MGERHTQKRKPGRTTVSHYIDTKRRRNIPNGLPCLEGRERRKRKSGREGKLPSFNVFLCRVVSACTLSGFVSQASCCFIRSQSFFSNFLQGEKKDGSRPISPLKTFIFLIDKVVFLWDRVIVHWGDTKEKQGPFETHTKTTLKTGRTNCDKRSTFVL